MCVLSDYEPTTMLCMPVKVQIGSESRVIAVAVACNKKNEKKLEFFPSLPSSSLPSSFCSSITSLPPFSLFSLPPLLPFHFFRLLSFLLLPSPSFPTSCIFTSFSFLYCPSGSPPKTKKTWVLCCGSVRQCSLTPLPFRENWPSRNRMKLSSRLPEISLATSVSHMMSHDCHLTCWPSLTHGLCFVLQVIWMCCYERSWRKLRLSQKLRSMFLPPSLRASAHYDVYVSWARTIVNLGAGHGWVQLRYRGQVSSSVWNTLAAVWFARN